MNITTASYHLSTYPLISIMIIGLAGNAFIFYIFLRPNFRASTITSYVRILAVSDSIVILTGCLQNIYHGYNRPKDLAATSSAGCILLRFIMFVAGDISVWILVVITLDRYIAVVHPTKNRVWKADRNVLIVQICLCVAAVLKNFPVFFTFYLDNNGQCQKWAHMKFYAVKIRPAISLVLYYLIPAVSMTVFTVLILIQMHKVSTRLRVSSTPSAKSTSAGQKHYSKSLTRMCIAINILFFLLITPSITIWTIIDYGNKTIKNDLYGLFYDITNIFVFSHHALNFYLFFVTGPRFRREVMMLFGKNYSQVDDSKDYTDKSNKNPQVKNDVSTSFNQ